MLQTVKFLDPVQTHVLRRDLLADACGADWITWMPKDLIVEVASDRGI